MPVWDSDLERCQTLRLRKKYAFSHHCSSSADNQHPYLCICHLTMPHPSQHVKNVDYDLDSE